MNVPVSRLNNGGCRFPRMIAPDASRMAAFSYLRPATNSPVRLQVRFTSMYRSSEAMTLFL